MAIGSSVIKAQEELDKITHRNHKLIHDLHKELECHEKCPLAPPKYIFSEVSAAIQGNLAVYDGKVTVEMEIPPKNDLQAGEIPNIRLILKAIKPEPGLKGEST